MKNLQFIFIFTLLFSANWVQAQETLYLKDGSFINGTILEYLKGDHVRIQTADGKILSFDSEQVKKIRQKTHHGGPVVFSLKESGYFNATSAGVLFRRPSEYMNLSGNLGLETVNGYQFMKKYMVGLGVGTNFLSNRLYLPLFIDLRYNFRAHNFTPFLGIKAGYAFHLGKNKREYDIWYNPRNYQGGAIAGLEAGIRGYFSERFGMTFSLEYRFQQDISKSSSPFYNEWDLINQPVTYLTYMNQLGLRVGILFH